MTMIREFFSNFTKIKRTPMILLHLLSPIVVTTLFFLYYVSGGYHIITDVRLFFVILQICYPIFVSIVVPMLIHLDRNINNIQNALGLVESRRNVYLGKLLFLLFLFSLNMIIYEVCFYVGTNCILEMSTTHFDFYFIIFFIFMFSNLFIYLLHIVVAFRFGSSISILLGIAGTILAGYSKLKVKDLSPIETVWGVGYKWRKDDIQ